MRPQPEDQEQRRSSSGRRDAGQGLSGLHCHSLSLPFIEYLGGFMLCAQPRISFPGKCGTCPASGRPSPGTLRISGRSPFLSPLPQPPGVGGGQSPLVHKYSTALRGLRLVCLFLTWACQRTPAGGGQGLPQTQAGILNRSLFLFFLQRARRPPTPQPPESLALEGLW